MKTGFSRAFPFSAPRALLASLVLGGGLLLAGCAGNPPTAQMAVTQSAVNEAVSSGGNQYAPIETKSAQDKWTQAQTALSNEKVTPR
ncbi:chromosome partitioning protein ParA, partial [Pseudomonas oryzihabitans]